jgi:methyl-accepting chemotaxis protein
MATEQGSKAVEAGLEQAEEAGHSIQELSSSIGDAAQAAVQIAASSQEQLIGVDQVALAMNSVKDASTQNVTSMKQLEAAARDLSQVGQNLTQLVAKFRVTERGNETIPMYSSSKTPISSTRYAA